MKTRDELVQEISDLKNKIGLDKCRLIRIEHDLECEKLENKTWEEVSKAQTFKLDVVRGFLVQQTSFHFTEMLVRIIDLEPSTPIMD